MGPRRAVRPEELTTGQGNQVTIRGRSDLRGRSTHGLDITTQAGEASRYLRPYGPGLQIATYVRSASFTVFP